MRSPSLVIVVVASVITSAVAAQSTMAVRQSGPVLPPVRALSTPEATSTLTFTAVSTNSARVLSDGRVIVHDVIGRSVWLVDASLANASILVDKDGSTGTVYPVWPQVLLVGQGDTTYLSDAKARVLRVLTPDGRITDSVPFPERGPITFTSGNAGVVFAGHAMIFAPPIAPSPTGMGTAEDHDSLLLVRVDLTTRVRQQLGYVYLQASTLHVLLDSTSAPRQTAMALRVLDIGDAMAMNSLGMLAVIRASDFHVDWLMPDGRWRRTPPVPWTWHTYSPEEKQQLLEKGVAMIGAGNVIAVRPVGTPPTQVLKQVAPLPDVAPAFVPMSAIADHEGRVWVRLGSRSFYTRYEGVATYAAIDANGQIVDQISLPIGRTLFGFGPPGTAYVIAREGRIGTIERYSVRK